MSIVNTGIFFFQYGKYTNKQRKTKDKEREKEAMEKRGK